MTERAPGAMFSLGIALPEPRRLHSSTFDVNEDALPVGAAILAEAAASRERARQAPTFTRSNLTATRA